MHFICGYESNESLAYSRFAPSKESPLLPLYDDIIRFASMWDIVLLGYFYTWTKEWNKWGHVWRSYGRWSWSKETTTRYRQINQLWQALFVLRKCTWLMIYDGLSKNGHIKCFDMLKPNDGARIFYHPYGSPSLMPKRKRIHYLW